MSQSTMSQSTDGQICFGVLFEEDFKFPWDDEKYSFSIEDWWKDVQGFKPVFCPYLETTEFGYKDGVTMHDPRIDVYHKHEKNWFKENPIPVKLVNVRHSDYPIYIIAIPDTFFSASRGNPKMFEVEFFKKIDEEQLTKTLIDFCGTYGIEYSGESGWYLSSYWG